MIKVFGNSERQSESVMGYFRVIFAERPDLLDSPTNQELLDCWLRDHPDQTEVPPSVKNRLAHLKSKLRKKRRDGEALDGKVILSLHEAAPVQVLPVEGKPAKRAETIHDRAGETIGDARGQKMAERRSEPRHAVRTPLVAVPVLPDGSPDWEHRVGGTTLDVSHGGMALELNSPAELPTTSLLLMFHDPEEIVCCAGLEVRHSQLGNDGVLRLGGSFGGFAEEILHPENLHPTFHPNTMEFASPLSEGVLRKWAEIGVLREDLRDRVQLCPKCHGLPTFRQGCPTCGSADLTNDQLMHHYACAHVGFVSDFEAEGELICPKCRTRHLIVGADFEHCTGSYRCRDCHWSDVELEQVAQCLRCEFRFPAHQAYEQELRGYCANRLDPLALLPASGPALGVAGRVAPDGRPALRAV